MLTTEALISEIQEDNKLGVVFGGTGGDGAEKSQERYTGNLATVISNSLGGG